MELIIKKLTIESREALIIRMTIRKVFKRTGKVIFWLVRRSEVRKRRGLRKKPMADSFILLFAARAKERDRAGFTYSHISPCD